MLDFSPGCKTYEAHQMRTSYKKPSCQGSRGKGQSSWIFVPSVANSLEKRLTVVSFLEPLVSGAPLATALSLFPAKAHSFSLFLGKEAEYLCTVQGVSSGCGPGLCRLRFGEFPWLVGCYCSYLLPRLGGETSQI